MAYQLLATSKGRRSLEKCPPEVMEAAKELADDPRPHGSTKMVLHEKGENQWRLKLGDYRIIYLINDKERSITIGYAGHRRDVYHEWE